MVGSGGPADSAACPIGGIGDSTEFSAELQPAPMTSVGFNKETIDGRIVGLLSQGTRLKEGFQSALDPLYLGGYPAQRPFAQSNLHTRIPIQPIHRKCQPASR